MKRSRKELEKRRKTSVEERLESIYHACNDIFGIDIADKKRDSYHVMARSVYFKIALEIVTDATLLDIGFIVDRDHATVIHAQKLLEWHYEGDARFQEFHQKVIDKLELKEVEIKEEYKDYTTRLKEELTRLKVELMKSNKIEEKYIYDIELEPHEVRYRQLPEDKKEKFRVRVEAILKMI